jgi:hypothetical protein
VVRWLANARAACEQRPLIRRPVYYFAPHRFGRCWIENIENIRPTDNVVVKIRDDRAGSYT